MSLFQQPARQRKSFDHGVQLVFRNGAKISVYHAGSVIPQGKHVDTVNELLGRGAPQRALAVTVRDTRNDYFIAACEDTKVSSRSVRIVFASYRHDNSVN